MHLKISNYFLMLWLALQAISTPASAQIAGETIPPPAVFFQVDTFALPPREAPRYHFDYSKYYHAGPRNIIDSIFNDSLQKLHPMLDQAMSMRLVDSLEQYRPSKSQIKELNIKDRNWIFVVSCIILTLIIIFRLLNKRRFSEYIFSVFNPRLNNKIIRDQGISLVSLFIQLTFIHIFIASLLLWIFLQHANPASENGIFTYLFIVVALIFIYLLKYMLQFIISDIFMIDEVALFHLNSVIAVNTATSLLLFPILLVYIYYPSAVFKSNIILIISGLLILSIVVRIVKFFFQSLDVFRYPKLYLFLYICGFEVAPWLFIIKLFLKD